MCPDCAINRNVHAHEISLPPPCACPLIAATVGCGIDSRSVRQRYQEPGSPSTGSPRPIFVRSSRSACATKNPSTPPVRTTTWTDVSLASSFNTPSSSVIAAKLMKLRGGRVNVHTAIRSRRSISQTPIHEGWVMRSGVRQRAGSAYPPRDRATCRHEGEDPGRRDDREHEVDRDREPGRTGLLFT